MFTGDHDILSRERKAAIQVALGVNIEGNRIPFEVAYIAVSKKGEDVGEIVISFSICEEDGDNMLDWGEEIKDLLGDNVKITLLGNDSTKSDVIINVTTDGEFKEEDKENIRKWLEEEAKKFRGWADDFEVLKTSGRKMAIAISSVKASVPSKLRKNGDRVLKGVDFAMAKIGFVPIDFNLFGIAYKPISE